MFHLWTTFFFFLKQETDTHTKSNRKISHFFDTFNGPYHFYAMEKSHNSCQMRWHGWKKKRVKTARNHKQWRWKDFFLNAHFGSTDVPKWESGRGFCCRPFLRNQSIYFMIIIPRVLDTRAERETTPVKSKKTHTHTDTHHIIIVRWVFFFRCKWKKPLQIIRHQNEQNYILTFVWSSKSLSGKILCSLRGRNTDNAINICAQCIHFVFFCFFFFLCLFCVCMCVFSVK